MRTRWPTDPRMLTEATGPGWGGLWSLLYTAERAVAALGQVVSFAEGMDLLWLGTELRQAADDAARSHPDDVAAAVAVDLGPLSESWRVERDTPAYVKRTTADELRALAADTQRVQQV